MCSDISIKWGGGSELGGRPSVFFWPEVDELRGEYYSLPLAAPLIHVASTVSSASGLARFLLLNLAILGLHSLYASIFGQFSLSFLLLQKMKEKVNIVQGWTTSLTSAFSAATCSPMSGAGGDGGPSVKFRSMLSKSDMFFNWLIGSIYLCLFVLTPCSNRLWVLHPLYYYN